jgi:hypothetical protein
MKMFIPNMSASVQSIAAELYLAEGQFFSLRAGNKQRKISDMPKMNLKTNSFQNGRLEFRTKVNCYVKGALLTDLTTTIITTTTTTAAAAAAVITATTAVASTATLYAFTALWILATFSFLILYAVGRTPWTRDKPVARPLPAHRTT